MINSRTLAHTALILLEKENAEKHIDAFLAYLTENNLTGLLPQVQQHIERLSAQKAGDETLHIHSKHYLSEGEISDIKKLTGALEADVLVHTDESVVGGFSATYQGHIYDGSVAHQLTRLKTTLTR
jgi:F0F1-type ATP synthase delta subunit